MIYMMNNLPEQIRRFFETSQATAWRQLYNTNPTTTHFTLHPYFVFGNVVLYLFVVIVFQYLFCKKRNNLTKQDLDYMEKRVRFKWFFRSIFKKEVEKSNELTNQQKDALLTKIMDDHFGFIRNKGPIFSAYNILCIGLSFSSLCLQLYAVLTYKTFSPVCGGYMNRENLPHFKFAIWCFYIAKFIEFFDTFIMLMKLPSSEKQLSFLHIYHHASIPIVVWFYIMQSTGSMEWLAVSLNSFIHVIMYSYYFIKAQPWPNSHPLKIIAKVFKPVITSGQLVQFLCILIQCLYAIYIGDGCGWFTHLKWIQVCYMLSMLGLFGNFFVQSYITPKKKTIGSKQKKK